ncbi:winged helix DNA-binding domain-containing protein [Adhaeribacter rhizoryzae]|uniref:Winged helix DNA-binding domain-containing protein n=1 Tax=Adhaeribacter rhizoryzae TaxID=2607907 RepID=A0A5M6DMP1_9BACT|nr:winged helix DNA-binding domain-containing protein [Adhaeribacter rhizoryzae]KAA5548663.1 winged helix DNA-binding domain-containing protein [Adhaeribacter rhizoryzae]
MELTEIGNIRLYNQQISGTPFTSAQEIVSWLGAIQAQDFAMGNWAIGVRLPNSTEAQIEAALNEGKILRTHILRPTWHFVSAEDIYPLLALSAPQIKSVMKPWLKKLELTDALIAKSNAVLEKALAQAECLTREALAAELRQSGIITDNNRASLLLMHAEQDAIICSGPVQKNKQTYALLAKRVPQKQSLTRAETLAKLANTYFLSHGPATVQDFAWWSGLPITDARKALEAVKANFIAETINAGTYWFSPAVANFTSKPTCPYFLPAFDEFIISYKDRTAVLLSEYHKKAISNNGLFRPMVVTDGKVTGLWKRTINKDTAIIETEFFDKPTTNNISLLQQAAQKYSSFLQKNPDIQF